MFKAKKILFITITIFLIFSLSSCFGSNDIRQEEYKIKELAEESEESEKKIEETKEVVGEELKGEEVGETEEIEIIEEKTYEDIINDRDLINDKQKEKISENKKLISPIIINKLETAELHEEITGLRCVAVDKNYVYAANFGFLFIIDTSNRENLSIEGMEPCEGWCVYPYEDYIYFTNYFNGFEVVGISEPFWKGFFTPGRAHGIFVDRGYVYIADYEKGLHVIDIDKNLHKKENWSDAIIEGTCNTPGYAVNVFVDGNYAYVADDIRDLQIIDITDKKNPHIIGSCKTPGFVYDVFIKEDYAYVADTYNGLHIIDISDRESPYIVGSCDAPDFANRVFVDGNYAFVADYGSGLKIIDISIKGNPKLVESLDLIKWAFDVAIEGDYAYVADAGFGLYIVKVYESN